MSDTLTHECGIAVVRLRKPIEYYYDRYGTCLWGFSKLFLLMEKQHNRGQDGVGIACTKLSMPLGEPYLFRRRSVHIDGLAQVFRKESKAFHKAVQKGLIDPDNPASVKSGARFGGEILIGHLRYGSTSGFGEGACHPFLRRSNWPTRTLMVMGNFNMTNTRQLNEVLIDRGQHPVFGTDTQTVLEEIGFHLDETHTDIYRALRDGGMSGSDIPAEISQRLDVGELLQKAAEQWDGGYSIGGVIGNGDLFMMRDPRGIRPCYVLINEEVIAFASERVPLMTVFEAEADEVQELTPGTVMTVKGSGEITETRFAPEMPPRPCSFEKIYFSRGNDPEIYQKRKELGAALVPQVVQQIEGRVDHAVFSFIPNTAEVAWYGLMEGLQKRRRKEVRTLLKEAMDAGNLREDLLDEVILNNWPVGEKIAHKDVKLRTFIAQEKSRNQLVSHVYDVTYGVVKADEALVVLDDSIVRGTTLRKSILKMLARTSPKKIIICSTAPQIRYPDCYGIDMPDLSKLIAFQAVVRMYRRVGRQAILSEIARECRQELYKPWAEVKNVTKRIYENFSAVEIAAEISAMVRPESIAWKGEIQIIFQTIENLRAALGENCGDWYFTGDYPTPGGNVSAVRSYLDWYETFSHRNHRLPL